MATGKSPSTSGRSYPETESQVGKPGNDTIPTPKKPQPQPKF